MTMKDTLYNLGPEGKYTLDIKALKHIVEGEFNFRVDRSEQPQAQRKIITGGLHTITAWNDFLKASPDIVHLADFDSDAHTDWYFARELQNGVIILKIPRILFNNSAAQITIKPEVYYKSGYLWKTLFPKHYSVEKIISCIDESIKNLDLEESDLDETLQQRILIGYSDIDDPLRTLKIRVQLIGNEIKSAFPCWSQPMTGNNGKPFSHEHSINYHIAQSTIGVQNDTKNLSALFNDDLVFKLERLISLTPTFLQHRQIPNFGEAQDKWNENNAEWVAEISENFSSDEAAQVVKFLSDFTVCKEPVFLQQMLYSYYIDFVNGNSLQFNIAQVFQNVYDSFYALCIYDDKNKTSYVDVCIDRFLSMAVIHTGGLNLLLYKRLLQNFVRMSFNFPTVVDIARLFERISTSPIRSALYTEFDLNPYVKQNNEEGLAIIGFDGVEMPLDINHLYDFIALNLGENYLVSFSTEQRLKIASRLCNSIMSKELINDSLLYVQGADFDFFTCAIAKLAESPERYSKPEEKCLTQILKDYHRILIVHRQRIVLEDTDSYWAQPDYSDYGSDEFYKLQRQKHKYMFVKEMHRQVLEAILRLSKHYSYDSLMAKAESLLVGLPKEGVPMPKRVPDYIRTFKPIHDSEANIDNEIDSLFI